VKHSNSTLGMDESPRNSDRLSAIHKQMQEEARRIHQRRQESIMKAEKDEESLTASPPSDKDYLEVGYITLYCECLMGVSLVSVKLAHKYYENYMRTVPQDMAQDTYLFVSPSQLKKATSDANTLPRVDMPH